MIDAMQEENSLRCQAIHATEIQDEWTVREDETSAGIADAIDVCSVDDAADRHHSGQMTLLSPDPGTAAVDYGVAATRREVSHRLSRTGHALPHFSQLLLSCLVERPLNPTIRTVGSDSKVTGSGA
ncbi:hypothetical protein I553_6268 [Mycobacterium xenopi 4042]|uniref:Uncharacterized protein n=1 Tax=Mycobacterium xenopi 4042 TaxID=1299334 RepID=X8BGQ3_MYCXE|nr:hypothetical protein I553_6268 [Mycobacterium xenopi 4042]